MTSPDLRTSDAAARPVDPPRIRPIAICLVRRDNHILVRDNHILVLEDQDPVKGDRFCRPLGGAVEFGEQSRDAVVREIREELGAELEDVRLVGVLESLFTYLGRPGHEIVFVYDATLADRALYERDTLSGYEAEVDMRFAARWMSLGEMERRGLRLVPEGLAELLRDA